MALNVLPHEIPVSGERYNVTLRKTGFGKGTHNAKFVIDGGDKRGHIVSTGITPEIHTELLKAAQRLGYGKEEGQTDRIDNPKFHVFLNKEARHIRFEAELIVTYMAAINDMMVEVEPDYQESNVMVVYEMARFSKPTASSELNDIFKVKTSQ